MLLWSYLLRGTEILSVEVEILSKITKDLWGLITLWRVILIEGFDYIQLKMFFCLVRLSCHRWICQFSYITYTRRRLGIIITCRKELCSSCSILLKIVVYTNSAHKYGALRLLFALLRNLFIELRIGIARL